VLFRQDLFFETKALQKRHIELRFYGPNCDVFAVRGLVCRVKRCTPGKNMRTALPIPFAALPTPQMRRHQSEYSVYHRGIDHLSTSTALSFDQCCKNTDKQKHATTAEISHQIERGGRGRLL